MSALEAREEKTNPQRDRELVAKGASETWRNQRESIIQVLPVHLPVTPILPGSYCRRYFTSCARVLGMAGRTPQRDRDGEKLQYM